MQKVTLLTAALVGMAALARPAFPWGSAIHAYIDAQLGDRGIQNKDMIYGGLAADAFNFFFEDPEAMEYLYGVTHGLVPSNNDLTLLALLQGAATRRQESFALGFYSHNNFNAADMTGHGYPYNSPNGYIIKKTLILREILRPSLTGAGLSLPEPVLLEVSHILVEYAADILIREADRSIGATMVSAAATRQDVFAQLVAETYAPGLAQYLGIALSEAHERILEEERDFRVLIMAYGKALQKGDKQVIDIVVGFLAGVAQDYLGMFGIPVPGDQLVPLLHGGILAGTALCRDDLIPAVEDTIDHVAGVVAAFR